MKYLSQWQRELGKADRKKFPKNIKKWKEQDRLLSVLRQLADVGGAIQKKQGIYPSKDPKHTEPNHRIAALVADILILCDKRNVDLDAELGEVLNWYREMENPDLEDFILKLRKWHKHEHGQGDRKLPKELTDSGRKLGLDIKPV
jgi:hypothetical protein